jgi:hypothetical protein
MNVIRELLRLREVRRVEAGWGLSLAGNLAATVALVVYAYAEGGPGLVAVYGVVRTLPGAVVVPAITSLVDRVGIDRLLRIVTSVRAVVLAGAASAAAVDAPPAAVIALAGVEAALAGSFRPIQAAALPWLVRTPAELTAANVSATVMENLASLLGPVLAGVVLLLAGPATALAVGSGCMAAASITLMRLEVPDRSMPTPGGPALPAPTTMSAVRAFLRVGSPAGLAVLAFTQTFLRGAVFVLIVVLAVDVLSLGEDAVGWLTAAIGLGGLVGAAVAAAAVRITRLGRSFVVGNTLWGLPLLVLALDPSPAAAYAALAVVGIGNAIGDASMFTLLPRVVGPRLTGRVMGVLELVAFTGVAAGSALAPVLIDGIGPRGTLATLGGAMTVLAAAYAAVFARLDRTTPAPGPELELLRALPMFGPLPLVTVEQLAAQLESKHYEPGLVVMREGDPGDVFHVVVDGRVEVSAGGVRRPDLGRGEGFGEIALLRDVPRTATVSAAGPLQTVTLARSAFLAAVSGNRDSLSSALAVAQRRLDRDRAPET